MLSTWVTVTMTIGLDV